MSFSQKLGIFFLIVITAAYLYFAFFAKEGFKLPESTYRRDNEIQNTTPQQRQEENVEAPTQKHDIQTVKIYVTDEKGNLRSVNRRCDKSAEKSCFAFAIRELISAPTNWERDKGLSSEIPANTRILSIREGSSNILIDLSPAFESGGGAESIYIRIKQLIKTAQANTKLPVFLYINGKQANVISGEGIMIKQPLTERSLDD